jgi:hypothetical protein
MQVPQSVGREFYRQARGVVPAVLFMSIVLGLFNASEWTLAAIWPKVALSFGIGLLGCVLGLIALWIGLQVAVWRQDLMQGWLAGLVAGFAGIAFMLWYFANPVS